MNPEQLVGRDLVIPLPRPEYVSMPEGFISAIAWRAYAPASPVPSTPGKKTGLRFLPHAGFSQISKTVEFVRTAPSGEVLGKFQSALEKFGLQQLGTQDNLAQAVINSITGTSTDKSKFLPASPLTPAVALLQNNIGMSGKGNPPDLALILETIYLLGAPIDAKETLVKRYTDANAVRLAADPVLKAIDAAFTETIWGGSISIKADPPIAIPKCKSFMTDSPFTWFAEAWDKVTSKEWVLALPARVWVDWATSVLRMGYSLAFLWEAAWYESLARELLSNRPVDQNTVARVLEGMDQPLIWKSSDASAEIRDVSSKLKWRCYRSVEIRNLVEHWLKVNIKEDEPIFIALQSMQSDESLLKGLQKALFTDKDQNSGSAKNLWEAIRYSLKTRERGDHYGFLVSSGTRFLFASPGIEWAALVASLTAEGPGKNTNLGEISAKLTQLGTTPNTKEILRLLEKTGLARGSADADLALHVETAYKGVNS